MAASVTFLNLICYLIVIILFTEFTIAVDKEHFVFWPNGTVPFYVNPNHFDKEQSTSILSTLSNFTMKTCLQFRPVMAAPGPNQHVMVFENPRGVRKCVIDMEGHAKEEPHRITLGYNCLRSPQVELVIMKALGFPFEHNRAMRDLYIDVNYENIQPGFIPFFTKEKILPKELRDLPYDVNSVMHFSDRDYSKNGHRSFIFKYKKTKQNRIGLSKTDLKKIDVIYGSECEKRDRQAKIDMCKKYPSVRRKRDVTDFDIVQNLRINRNITPPPDEITIDDISHTIDELHIDKEIEDLIDIVHKISAIVVENERAKICNNTNFTNSDNSKNHTVTPLPKDNKIKSNEVTDIIKAVVNYANEVVTDAKSNLTLFCDTTNNVELYQRAKCNWGSNKKCPQTFKSTKSGAVKYSTKHSPIIRQSTKHDGKQRTIPYVQWLRFGNYTDSEEANATRRKLETEVLIEDLGTKFTRRKRDTEGVNIKDIKEYLAPKARMKRNVKVVNIRKLKDNLAFKTNRRKRDTEVVNNIDTKEDLIFKDTRIKRNVKVLNIRDIKLNNTQKQTKDLNSNFDIPTDNFKDVEKFANVISIRRKRDTKSVLHLDNATADSGKIDENVSNKANDAVKELVTKDSLQPMNANGSRDEHTEVDEVMFGSARRGHVRQVKLDRKLNKRSKGKRGGKGRGRLPETVTLTKKNKEFYAERIWSEGVVRYVIAQEPNYNLESMRARLEEVNNILRKKTCVRIEEVSEREGRKCTDYLVIDTSPDYVTGRVGGRQVFGSIELFEGGQHRQHAAMMVMAMLGFYFELSRHDRDTYVRVHNRHIRPDKLHHFEKIRSDATLDLPYDYTSATHPAWQFWRRVGRTGISTVATYKDQDPDGSIMRSLGQNEELLSKYDIIKINSVYGVQCFQNQRRMQTQTTNPEIEDVVDLT